MDKLRDFADEQLVYLDNLRISGKINMYGAAPFLEAAFAISRKEARLVLSCWMKTFAERHPSV